MTERQRPINSFTTPPLTRKRKALEAATATTREVRPSGGNNCTKESQLVRGLNLCADESSKRSKQVRSTSEIGATSGTEQIDAVACQKKASGPVISTPVVTTIETDETKHDTMDSDDEFMSDNSSQDVLGTQGSDVDSLGEGYFFLPILPSFS